MDITYSMCLAAVLVIGSVIGSFIGNWLFDKVFKGE